MNQRLRGAILAAGLTIPDLSAKVGVDPKTVERWVSTARTPHRATRRQVAKILRVDEVHLWPSLADDLRTGVATENEVIHIYPSRSALPYSLWTDLIGGVTEQMDVLVFSGQFLVEQHDILPVIRKKVAHGTRFRFLVGDEKSSAVIQRATEEGTSGGLEGRVQMMRRYLRDIAHLPGVEVRTHGTILYNSIYRFDSQLLVNGHAYGALAGQNPVLHLRRVDESPMWLHYMDSFERVWIEANEETTQHG